MEKVIRYKCNYCGKLFLTILKCKEHERYEHECIKCKYSRIVGQYSDEIECTRKRCINGDI